MASRVGTLLSDLINRSMPKEWLREVYPALIGKPERKLMNRVDGVFYFAKGSSSVEPCFLALTALFDSADDAIQALREAEAQPRHATTRRRRASAPQPGLSTSSNEA